MSFLPRKLPMISLSLALMLTGCHFMDGTAQTKPELSNSEFCMIAQPIRLTHREIDSLSDGTVSQILLHNAEGQSFCGWQP